MNKTFVKIILVGALFVGGFFVGDNAKALNCCLIKAVLPNNVELSCRLEGSTACSPYVKDYKVGEGEKCPVPLVQKPGMLSAEYVCPVFKSMEEQVNCVAYQICKDAAAKALVGCETFKDSTECGLKPAVCFWSTNRRQCISTSDKEICPSLNATDCAQMKPAGCEWKDDQCLSPFGQDIRKKYSSSADKQNFLPSCALDGSCRKLSDLIGVVLKIVNWIFKYIGAIAFIFFVYGGFTMILSFGNAEKFKKGQQVLVAAVIGLVIVFSAYLLVSFVLDALGVAGEFKVVK